MIALMAFLNLALSPPLGMADKEFHRALRSEARNGEEDEAMDYQEILERAAVEIKRIKSVNIQFVGTVSETNELLFDLGGAYEDLRSIEQWLLSIPDQRRRSELMIEAVRLKESLMAHLNKLVDEMEIINAEHPRSEARSATKALAEIYLEVNRMAKRLEDEFEKNTSDMSEVFKVMRAIGVAIDELKPLSESEDRLTLTAYVITMERLEKLWGRVQERKIALAKEPTRSEARTKGPQETMSKVYKDLQEMNKVQLADVKEPQVLSDMVSKLLEDENSLQPYLKMSKASVMSETAIRLRLKIISLRDRLIARSLELRFGRSEARQYDAITEQTRRMLARSETRATNAIDVLKQVSRNLNEYSKVRLRDINDIGIISDFLDSLERAQQDLQPVYKLGDPVLKQAADRMMLRVLSIKDRVLARVSEITYRAEARKQLERAA